MDLEKIKEDVRSATAPSVYWSERQRARMACAEHCEALLEKLLLLEQELDKDEVCRRHPKTGRTFDVFARCSWAASLTALEREDLAKLTAEVERLQARIAELEDTAR